MDLEDTAPADSLGLSSDRVRALVDATISLGGVADIEDLLRRVVEAAATIAGARYAALGVYEDDGRIARFVHRGVDELTVRRIGHLPEGRGLLGAAIVTDAPIRLADLGADPRAAGFPPDHPPMRTFLGVPISRPGHRYGNLYVCEKQDRSAFDEVDEALMVTLAAIAAGAIAGADLLEAERARAQAIGGQVAAKEQARARREVLAATIAAQESERARVARDLHDDVGQALTSVLLGMRLVEDSLSNEAVDVSDARRRTADLRELVAEALRGARQLAFDLRPTVLDDVGLTPALSRLCSQASERSGVDIDVFVGLPPDERLPSNTETVIYRVVQEALTNVLRHARASSASVTVATSEERVRVIVEDDGKGFDAAASGPRSHLGIRGMEERAQIVGGTVEVMSGSDGTTVVLEVPRG